MGGPLGTGSLSHPDPGKSGPPPPRPDPTDARHGRGRSQRFCARLRHTDREASQRAATPVRRRAWLTDSASRLMVCSPPRGKGQRTHTSTGSTSRCWRAVACAMGWLRIKKRTAAHASVRSVLTSGSRRRRWRRFGGRRGRPWSQGGQPAGPGWRGAPADRSAPTLPTADGHDRPVIGMNKDAMARMRAPTALVTVPGRDPHARGPGPLQEVAELVRGRFVADQRARDGSVAGPRSCSLRDAIAATM
jgi:hypothetical protein